MFFQGFFFVFFFLQTVCLPLDFLSLWRVFVRVFVVLGKRFFFRGLGFFFFGFLCFSPRGSFFFTVFHSLKVFMFLKNVFFSFQVFFIFSLDGFVFLFTGFGFSFF